MRIAAFLSCALLLGACGREPVADTQARPALAHDANHYVDEHEGYSILLPEGWTTETRRSASIVLTRTERDAEGFAVNVAVAIQRNPAGAQLAGSLLDLFTAKTKQDVKRRYGVGVEEEGTAQVAGESAAWIRYRLPTQGMLLACQTWIVPHGDRIFLVQGMARSEDFDAWLPAFEEIAQSLQLR